MENDNSITFERKNKEGFTVETPLGPITVILKLKFNKENRFNGRMAVTVTMPESVNLYRINTKGASQNKKAGSNGKSKEANSIRSIKSTYRTEERS